MRLSRRGMLIVGAVGPMIRGAGVDAAIGGTLVDYAGGIPAASAIRAAGHVGAIRYVSDRRPGADWMIGKPLGRAEVNDLRANGLQIVSCYQYEKGPKAEWRGGEESGKQHAQRAQQLQQAAGGPSDCPIYASIDDNPSPAEINELVLPFLTGWQAVLGRQNSGVYANSPTLDAIQAAGLCSWYWQHDWGTPPGVVNPRAHLHQIETDKRQVGGVQVDVNTILAPNYGAWGSISS